VNVRRPPLDGLRQHLVDELDDGGVLGAPGEVDAVLVLLDDLDAGVRRVGYERLEGVGADAQALLDAPVNFGGGRQREPELLS
jgi:hypothetical protein